MSTLKLQEKQILILTFKNTIVSAAYRLLYKKFL